jgi:hypothetical protein
LALSPNHVAPPERAIRSVTHLVLALCSLSVAVVSFEPKGVPQHRELPSARFSLGLISLLWLRLGAVKPPPPSRFARSTCAQSRLLEIQKTFSAALCSFSFTRKVACSLQPLLEKSVQPFFDSQPGRIAFKVFSFLTVTLLLFKIAENRRLQSELRVFSQPLFLALRRFSQISVSHPCSSLPDTFVWDRNRFPHSSGARRLWPVCRPVPWSR